MGLGLLQAIAGGALWALANAVYFDMKRKGTRGFRRFLAFWFGTPTTWATFFLVPEGSMDLVKPPPDDEIALLTEIRQDRAQRIAADVEERQPVDEAHEAPTETREEGQ